VNVSQNPLLGQAAARTASHSGGIYFSARAGPGGRAVEQDKHVACQGRCLSQNPVPRRAWTARAL